MPSIIEMHTSADLLPKWIHYGTLDAEATFYLREVLINELKKYRVDFEDMTNLWDFYIKYWLPFGELLTEIEREGIRVNLDYLQKAEQQALKDIQAFKENFNNWVQSTQEDAYEFNPSSTQQLQQLLYAPFRRVKVKKNYATNKILVDERDFSANDWQNNLDRKIQSEELSRIFCVI